MIQITQGWQDCTCIECSNTCVIFEIKILKLTTVTLYDRHTCQMQKITLIRIIVSLMMGNLNLFDYVGRILGKFRSTLLIAL